METTVKKSLIERVLDFKEIAILEIPEGATAEEAAELEAKWEAEMAARFASIEEKVNAYFHIVERENFKAAAYQPEIEARRRELEFLIDAQARHSKEAERVEARLVKCLQELGQPVIAEGREFKAVKNGGKPSLILDLQTIPEEYKKIPEPVPVPDKEMIRAVLNLGTKLEFARFGPPTYRLSVKGA
jgi:hypothetical protein